MPTRDPLGSSTRTASAAPPVAGLFVLLLLSSPTVSAEPHRGQMLYENHCQSCHEEWAHRREQSKVTTPAELRRRVAAWSVHSGLDWGDEEINDVVDYLDQTFYKFTE